MSDETTFDDVKLYILTKATASELSVIVDYYKVRHKTIGLAIGLSFKAGDTVQWAHSKTGKTVTGKFIKQMSKNAEVFSDDGVRWRVSPQLLRKP